MTKPIGEKGALEQATVEQFATQFNASQGRGILKFVTLLKPPHADAQCVLDGKDLFVEVAHVYGTSSDARLRLGRIGHAEPTPEERFDDSLIPLNIRVLSPLNQLLSKKSEKKYDSSPTWLVIRNGFPVWEIADFQEHLDQIIMPKAHPFSEIWLVGGAQANSGFLRLA